MWHSPSQCSRMYCIYYCVHLTEDLQGVVGMKWTTQKIMSQCQCLCIKLYLSLSLLQTHTTIHTQPHTTTHVSALSLSHSSHPVISRCILSYDLAVVCLTEAMNNYHISLADSCHGQAQVIYETWQVILIKGRSSGCKVAGREQTLSGLSGSVPVRASGCREPFLSVRASAAAPQCMGPSIPQGTDSFPPEGKAACAAHPPPSPLSKTINSRRSARKTYMESGVRMRAECPGLANLSNRCVFSPDAKSCTGWLSLSLSLDLSNTHLFLLWVTSARHSSRKPSFTCKRTQESLAFSMTLSFFFSTFIGDRTRKVFCGAFVVSQQEKDRDIHAQSKSFWKGFFRGTPMALKKKKKTSNSS